MAETPDVVIVGGGAAGLMCAITAAQRGRRVQVIEGSNRVGKKILMSGGGRCNFTNTGTTPANFLSANPHFCKSALARYTPADFVALVERHGIAYHEKELGQSFCDESSKQVVRMLLDECAAAGVRIETRCSIERVRHNDEGFELDTSCGLSIPSMGTLLSWAMWRSGRASTTANQWPRNVRTQKRFNRGAITVGRCRFVARVKGCVRIDSAGYADDPRTPVDARHIVKEQCFVGTAGHIGVCNLPLLVRLAPAHLKPTSCTSQQCQNLARGNR